MRFEPCPRPSSLSKVKGTVALVAPGVRALDIGTEKEAYVTATGVPNIEKIQG